MRTRQHRIDQIKWTEPWEKKSEGKGNESMSQQSEDYGRTNFWAICICPGIYELKFEEESALITLK